MKIVRPLALFTTGKLPWLLVLAGVLGFLAAPLANSLSGGTPYLLALMMMGSGLNLSLKEIVQIRGSFILTFLALLLQLGLLPLVSFGLYQLLPDPVLATGLVAIGVAPSEITSALMTLLAGGKLALALAMRVMVFSIFLSVLLIPLWLGLFLGKSVPLDLTSMAVELGLIIALPFVLASGVRTRFPNLVAYDEEFSSLSALAVIALIFVVGGSLANFQLGWEVVWLGVACLVFNLAGYLVGWLLARLTHQPLPQQTALIFSSGMREFGIATTVALSFLPVGAAVAPAIYGLIMMVSASILATFLKKRLIQAEAPLPSNL